MAATAEAKKKAYKAGYALPNVQWPEGATDEQRTPGVHHCPFSTQQPEERAEWLKGLKDALEVPVRDPATILKEINDALEGEKR